MGNLRSLPLTLDQQRRRPVVLAYRTPCADIYAIVVATRPNANLESDPCEVFRRETLELAPVHAVNFVEIPMQIIDKALIDKGTVCGSQGLRIENLL